MPAPDDNYKPVGGSIQSSDPKDIGAHLANTQSKLETATTETKLLTRNLEERHVINVAVGRPDAERVLTDHRQNGLNECPDLEKALMWLQTRTSNRLKRGVEGTHQK